MNIRFNTFNTHQRGTTAIEFSFVFALLFGVFWAIVSYAMPFFLYQVMNQSVSEAARYALRVDPELTDNEIITVVNTYLVDEPLAVLPTTFKTIITTENPSPSTIATEVMNSQSYRTLTVSLNYPGCSTSAPAGCVVPALNLFGVSIPTLGAFEAQASVHLEQL
ncbi:TadE/TadG family type IV pilus assembly protein [Paraperlucidibaca sp.]|jgi:Flp pilus assembly protein TadG|uniref:TadE/TadG family type IV pilus assembly protein n=1 Tax=Paraperlucidibaca sp. TaxID=2708021 RepID=UPI0030F3B11D